MKIQLNRKEAIRIIQDYYLLNLTIEERGNILIAKGEEIEDENGNFIENKVLDYQYNKIILENYEYSDLIKDEYLESEIKNLLKKDIKIFSQKDINIKDFHSCVCCGYKTSFKRRLHSICPVCWWQDDYKDENEYSSPNRSTLKDYRNLYLSKENNSLVAKKYYK